MQVATEMPNLRHLRAFSVTAHNNSVKRAAAEVHLSQPAVSQAISKLEAEFGETLFLRSPSGMHCTPMGQILFRRVDRCLAEIERAIDLAADGKAGAPGDLARYLSTSQLRAVIAISEHGNFTVAARALQISQPSIQRTARLLEQVLKISLFIRTAKGIGMSPHGQRLAQGLKLAVREIEIATEEMQFLRGHKSGRVVIGSLPLARVDIVPLAATRFLETYPDFNVRIVEGAYSNLLADLRDGGVDILVGALREPAPEDDVRQLTLFWDQLSVVVRSGHPLTRLPNVALTNTTGFPWIVPRPETPTRTMFGDMFRTRALEVPQRLLEVSSHVSLRGLLCESDRITLVSRRQISYEEQAGTLCVLPIRLPETARPIGLTVRSNWEPSEAQRQLQLEIERASKYVKDPKSA